MAFTHAYVDLDAALLAMQVTPRIINELPKDKTLHENELQHGDMIIFQRTPPPPPPVSLASLQYGGYDTVLHSPRCIGT